MAIQGLLPEEEYDTAGFLGFGSAMDRNRDGFIEPKQVGLPDRILEVLGFNTNISTNNRIPAENTPLVNNDHREGSQESFRYSSLFGMLLQLSGHS